MAGHGKFGVGQGKSKPKSNPGKSRVRGGSTKGQPKAKGSGAGQKHERVMTGPGSPY